jgi:hypothetical protein
MACRSRIGPGRHLDRRVTLVIGQIAAIYDVHGNLPALEAVLEDVRRAGVEQVVVGGDVLPGPMPRETLACLLGGYSVECGAASS